MAVQRIEILYDDATGAVTLNANAADAVTALWMLRAAESVFLKPTRSGVQLATAMPPANGLRKEPAR